jgi:hypothetical protein
MKIIHEARKIKSLYFLSEQLTTVTRFAYMPIFDYKESLKKEKALMRIFDNQTRNMKGGFIKWRNFVQIRAIQDSLTAEKRK